MDDIETKFKEIKKALKPFNTLSAIGVFIALVGAILLIVGFCLKNDLKSDIIFSVGIGLFSAAVVFCLSIVIVARKLYDEYYRLKKEIKKIK